MTTALDTNVISGLWGASGEIEAASRILLRCRTEGRLVVAGPVYAELAAHPRASVEFIRRFMAEFGVEPDFSLGAEVWQLAGTAFASYAERRRRAGHGTPKRLLADFIIGAHAQVRTDRLATFDRQRYATAFPRLRMIEP